MIRILDIAKKDLLQILRDRKTFMFLLIMPIAFTLFFAVALSGIGQSSGDARLPVGFLDQDKTALGGADMAKDDEMLADAYNNTMEQRLPLVMDVIRCESGAEVENEDI